MSISEDDNDNNNNNNPDDNVKQESTSIEESPEGQEAIETDNLEKMILSTGIRVGTPVKTKFMAPFIVKANPEGLYILDYLFQWLHDPLEILLLLKDFVL